ncbi:hypothetical protein BCR43DRAFT_263522 [Syncephalastrum racemosum]|uniref:Uncharacterized protein n=1 Tax=Syncephalastrum racemosum TaxID=13706 RepID=A0A1X2HGY5_SYNRA|nr:hypothetical protein BCR43DRAFT_263522 [Syncephalastrum racemosum]
MKKRSPPKLPKRAIFHIGLDTVLLCFLFTYLSTMQLLSSDTELSSEDKNDTSLDAVGRQLLGALGLSPGMGDLDLFSEFTTLGSSERLSESIDPLSESTSNKDTPAGASSHLLNVNHDPRNGTNADLFNPDMTMFPGVFPSSKEEEWSSLHGIPTPAASELPIPSEDGRHPALHPLTGAEKENSQAGPFSTDTNVHLHQQQFTDTFQDWAERQADPHSRAAAIGRYTQPIVDMAHARSMSLSAMPVVYGPAVMEDKGQMYTQCHAGVAQEPSRRFHPYSSLRNRSITDAPRARPSEEPWLPQAWATQWNVQPPIPEANMTPPPDMSTAQANPVLPNAGLSSAVSPKSPGRQRSHSSMSLERTMAWLATLADDITEPQPQPSNSDQMHIQTNTFNKTDISENPSQLEYVGNTSEWDIDRWMASLQGGQQQSGGQLAPQQQHQQLQQMAALSNTSPQGSSEHALRRDTSGADCPGSRDAYAAYTPHQATQLAALKAMAQQAQELLQTPEYRHPASRGGDVGNRTRYPKYQESADPQRQRRRTPKPKPTHPMRQASNNAPFNLEAIYRAQEEYNAQRLKQEEGELQERQSHPNGGAFCKYPPASANNFLCPSKRMKKDRV